MDGKRQQNGGIAVAKLKIDHDDLKEVVYNLDDDVLEPEKIPLLLGCIPTSEELSLLKACAYLIRDLCILQLEDCRERTKN